MLTETLGASASNERKNESTMSHFIQQGCMKTEVNNNNNSEY